MAHHVLYIPGLGDNKPALQIRVLKKWDKFGLETHFIRLNWTDDEPFEAKLEGVLKRIDELAGQGSKVSLVGTSAGASMALNAFAARKNKISSIVFICGKLRNPQLVNEKYFRANPAFRKSVFSAPELIEKLTLEDKAKMLTVSSAHDGLIPAHDSQIPGVKNRVLPVLLHVPTIFMALTLFKKIIINFIKSPNGLE